MRSTTHNLTTLIISPMAAMVDDAVIDDLASSYQPPAAAHNEINDSMAAAGAICVEHYDYYQPTE
jgi:hypothetical protein